MHHNHHHSINEYGQLVMIISEIIIIINAKYKSKLITKIFYA